MGIADTKAAPTTTDKKPPAITSGKALISSGFTVLVTPAMVAPLAQGLPRASVDMEKCTTSPTAGRRSRFAKALMCTNTRSPLFTGEMKPYPFASFQDAILPFILTDVVPVADV